MKLIRDGTILGPSGTQIDLRTEDYEVWITVKCENDTRAESVAAMLVKVFEGGTVQGIAAAMREAAGAGHEPGSLPDCSPLLCGHSVPEDEST